MYLVSNLIMRITKAFIGLILLGFVSQVEAQQTIPKWKIEDVTNFYNKVADSVYVINFWGTFCKPCLEEIPYLESISTKYKNQKVKLLLVSLDLPADYTLLSSFIAKNNIYVDVVWLDEDNLDHYCPPIDKKWMGDIPATLFVNTKTGYKYFTQDELTAEKFEAQLQKTITGTTPN
jgi:thiol-disulfide isomerase/thioredoxin